MIPAECRHIQRKWMREFDAGLIAPAEVAAHLAVCAECLSFSLASGHLRNALRALPLPEPDPVSDRSVATALGSARRCPAPAWRWVAAGVACMLVGGLFVSGGGKDDHDPAVETAGNEKHEVGLRRLRSQSAKADLVPSVARGFNRRAPARPSTGDSAARDDRRLLAAAHPVAPAPAPMAAVPRGDDFVAIPPPRLADLNGAQMAAALAEQRREAAIVDARLSRPVTLKEKGQALSDLCDRLRAETGIHLAAGRSVADEKVTVFCKGTALREVMRQLSRPFGYAWTRSGKEGEYRYELMQDLRSQLLEEELRNRDRHAALLALEREIERFRPYLHLLPDEALARAKTATSPAEKRLFERLGSRGWGPLQMYLRLSPREQAALRAGESLTFSQEPRPGERPLPPDLAKGILQSMRNWRLVKTEEGYRAHTDASDPRGVALVNAPDARAAARVMLYESEPGHFTLNGLSGAFVPRGFRTFDGEGPIATGASGGVAHSAPGPAASRRRRDSSLQTRVTLDPKPSCRTLPDPRAPEPASPEPRVTTADALEALHAATGMPMVADYYTRLYRPEVARARNAPLGEALDRLAEALRLRWAKEDGWLQFRSLTFYDDRAKEVPNRLLDALAAARRQHGVLRLEELVMIAGLMDAQLDGAEMAEGARALYGLLEWNLAREWPFREHVRFLAQFTPEQRREAQTPAGLPFAKLSLAQQQRYLSLALDDGAPPLQSMAELDGAALRVDYTHPGGFQWRPPGPEWLKWVTPIATGPEGRRAPTAPIRAGTREAVLAAARRTDPALYATMTSMARRLDPRADTLPPAPDQTQVAPTRLELEIIYIPGAANRRGLHVIRTRQDLNTNTTEAPE